MNNQIKVLLLIIATISCVVTIFFQSPIPQDSTYHNFADTRMLLGIANFWNVISNVPFFILGVTGLHWSLTRTIDKSSVAFITLSFGVAAIGLGSAYYHYTPSNASLVWDRIPMTITFMSFMSIVISRYVHFKAGLCLLFPLIALGVISVVAWYTGELRGAGDLRLYALVQFYPMICIPLILFIYPTSRQTKFQLLGLIFLYVVAKACEHFDDAIYNASHLLSGHSLKHFFAAGSILIMLRLNKASVASTAVQ